MPILNYTTKVSVNKTVGEIETCLADHGASTVAKQYGADKKIAAVCFVVETPNGQRPIRLPADVEGVKRALASQRVKADDEQAERVAWRILKDWVEAQMAIIEAQMVTMEEIFLPYMLIDGNRTVYQVYAANQLRISNGGSQYEQ